MPVVSALHCLFGGFLFPLNLGYHREIWGKCVERNSGFYPKIEPLRCLDPFLWCLYQLGIIDAEE